MDCMQTIAAYVPRWAVYVAFSVLWLFWSVVGFVLGKKGRNGRAFYALGCGISLSLVALLFWVWQAFGIVFLFVAVSLLGYIPPLLSKPKKKPSQVEYAVRQEAPMPQKVFCFEDECKRGSLDLSDGVLCAEHALSVLQKLQSIRLSEGDRLEAEKIRDSLRLLQGKDALSEEEVRLVNDCLTHLLKMMARYDL